jgi:hypothetical protein
MENHMSHYDEQIGASVTLGASGSGPEVERLPAATGTASDADSELAELRRNLLIYGTAGQAARSLGEARAL